MKSISLGRRTAVRFMLASLFFLLLGILEGLTHPTKFMFKDIYATVLGIDPQHIKAFFGYFVAKIHTHIALAGWVTTGMMGLFYFAAEEIRGGSRYRPWLCTGNLILQVAGVLALAIGFHLVGAVAIPTGHAAGSPEFRAAAQGVKQVVIAGGLTLLASCLLFIYSMVSTLLCPDRKLKPPAR